VSDTEFTEEMKESVAHDLFKFALMDFESYHLLVLSWMRHADLLQNMIRRQAEKNKVCIPPGTSNTMVCRNASASSIGHGKTVWTRLLNNTKLGTTVEHGQAGEPANNVNNKSQQLLHAFFKEIATLALPRAARAARQFAAGELDNGSDEDADQVLESLRDDNVDVIDLPPSFAKRSM